MSNTKQYFFYRDQEVEYRGKKEIRRTTVAGNQIGDTIYVGVAQCSPKDTFMKKTGRMIALGRAAKHPVASIKVSDNEPAGKLFVTTAEHIVSYKAAEQAISYREQLV